MKLFEELAVVLLISAVAGVGGCAKPHPVVAGTALPPNKLTPANAVRFAPYAMMAANAYDNPKREQFPVEVLGWQRVDLQGRATSQPTYENAVDLAFDIFRLRNTNQYVFAFRGTDTKVDYLWANLSFLFSFQYKSANKQFRLFQQAHRDADIIVIGHSLGGGLALSVSVRQGFPAIVFDPSPRIFDGLGDKHKPALREMVYEDGEILAGFRRLIPKASEVVDDKNIYKCEFNFGKKVSKHSIQALAIEILRMGAQEDQKLKRVSDAFSLQKKK